MSTLREPVIVNQMPKALCWSHLHGAGTSAWRLFLSPDYIRPQNGKGNWHTCSRVQIKHTKAGCTNPFRNGALFSSLGFAP